MNIMPNLKQVEQKKPTVNRRISTSLSKLKTRINTTSDVTKCNPLLNDEASNSRKSVKEGKIQAKSNHKDVGNPPSSTDDKLATVEIVTEQPVKLVENVTQGHKTDEIVNRKLSSNTILDSLQMHKENLSFFRPMKASKHVTCNDTSTSNPSLAIVAPMRTQVNGSCTESVIFHPSLATATPMQSKGSDICNGRATSCIAIVAPMMADQANGIINGTETSSLAIVATMKSQENESLNGTTSCLANVAPMKAQASDIINGTETSSLAIVATMKSQENESLTGTTTSCLALVPPMKFQAERLNGTVSYNPSLAIIDPMKDQVSSNVTSTSTMSNIDAVPQIASLLVTFEGKELQPIKTPLLIDGENRESLTNGLGYVEDYTKENSVDCSMPSPFGADMSGGEVVNVSSGSIKDDNSCCSSGLEDDFETDDSDDSRTPSYVPTCGQPKSSPCFFNVNGLCQDHDLVDRKPKTLNVEFKTTSKHKRARKALRERFTTSEEKLLTLQNKIISFENELKSSKESIFAIKSAVEENQKEYVQVISYCVNLKENLQSLLK